MKQFVAENSVANYVKKFTKPGTIVVALTADIVPMFPISIDDIRQLQWDRKRFLFTTKNNEANG